MTLPPAIFARLAPARVSDFLRAQRARREAGEWRRRGGSGPLPAPLKHELLRAHARRFGLTTLVETGTYLGDTVAALRRDFRRIVSIELSPELHRRASRRFARARGIELVQGDSGEVLPRVLAGIAEPCLLWLDGHYSAGITARGALESPVMQELEAIYAHPVRDHVVLIDDARCFDGSPGWPALEELRALVARLDPESVFEVADDVIRIHRADGAR